MLQFISFLPALALAAAVPLLPSEDPFYVQPANISSYKPGDIITQRKFSPYLNRIFPDDISLEIDALYQYLYRTTDSLGNPVAAVTSLLVPINANASELVVWQTAYDSPNIDCSPSYAFRAGANTTALADIVFITEALNQGWYVLSPDYEGLSGHFTAGLISGQATLDSIRAAFRATNESGLDPAARYIMYGYSGGTIGTTFAAELQPTYAPELENLVGAVMGGSTPNLTDVIYSINDEKDAGIAFSGIYGISKAYPNLTQWLDESLIPENRTDFLNIANTCLAQSPSYKNISLYFKNGIDAITEEAPASVLKSAGIMGIWGTPKIPLFIHHAIHDEVSPIQNTDNLVNKYCSEGVNIEYHRALLGDHTTEAFVGVPNALEWIRSRFRGRPLSHTSCVTKTVLLESFSLPSIFNGVDELVAIVETLLGGDLGSGVVG